MTTVTTCVSPPELTDEQINDLLDGEADMETQKHYEQCTYCAERVETARNVEMQLRTRLYRWNCPSPAMLRDYSFELLNGEDIASIEKHLEKCPHCREEYTQIQAFLEEPDDEEEPLEPKVARLPPTLPANAIYAEFVSEPAQAYRGVAASGVPVLRGQAPETLMFATNNETIFMELSPSSSGINMLNGQLIAEHASDHWERAIVEMWREHSLECMTIMDDMGAFQCQVNESGTIQVRIIAEDGKNIVIDDIVVET